MANWCQALNTTKEAIFVLILVLVLSKKMFEKQFAKLSIDTLTKMTQILKCVATNSFCNTWKNLCVIIIYTTIYKCWCR